MKSSSHNWISSFPIPTYIFCTLDNLAIDVKLKLEAQEDPCFANIITKDKGTK